MLAYHYLEEGVREFLRITSFLV